MQKIKSKGTILKAVRGKYQVTYTDKTYQNNIFALNISPKSGQYDVIFQGLKVKKIAN